MLFSFREFDIRQEKSAMKVGTDSVLLGCFTDVVNAKTILDIGSGTGLLALMMAQKSTAFIDAVELNNDAFSETQLNVNYSKWKGRINVYNNDIRDFKAVHPYDLIISNPPYFVHEEQFEINDLNRKTARHTTHLSFGELADFVAKNLHESGNFWLILPVKESIRFNEEAKKSGLKLHKQIFIKPSSRKDVNRVVQSYSLKDNVYTEENFLIYQVNGEYTPEYVNLTREFYLWKQFDNDSRLIK